MKKPRIYIDTSVIGGCFDAEFSQWSNGLMKDFAAGTFMPVLSDVVAAEVQDAPEAVRGQYETLLAGEHELVLVTEEVSRGLPLPRSGAAPVLGALRFHEE